MIELRNVCKYYNNDGIVALGLRNINLTLNKNEIVAIVGDSGSGKSTLLNVICGVDTYEDGEMLFKGNETSYFNQNDIDMYRKKNVGFIFQNYNIIDSYTVLDNVMLPMILNGVKKEEAQKRAEELIEKVGLSNRKHNKGTKLSGGEKQRCVIARALASDCDILACDEPTGNLDSKTGAEIIKLIKEVAEDKLVLIVTHNYKEVEDIITRRITISDGEVIEDKVIKKVEEENENEVVSFEDTTRGYKDVARVVFKNIKSTPRKTLFTFVVFLTISLIAFYLYLSCMASSQVSTFNPDNSFSLYEYNRVVAFNYDHSVIKDIDLESLEGEVYTNVFYEDLTFSAELRSSMFRKIKVPVIYTKHQISYEHLAGNEIVNINDAYLILPKNDLDRYSLMVTSYVNMELVVDETGFKFVGFGSSEYVKHPVLVTNKDIEHLAISQTYRTLYSLTVDIPSINYQTGMVRIYRDVPRPIVYLPKEYEIYKDEIQLSYMLNKIYPIITPSDVALEFTNSKSDHFKFCMPYDFIPEFEGIYELTIYADRPNEFINKLERKGLTTIRPSIDYTEVSQNQLLFYAYVGISTIIIFILVFVSYIILSRIYQSKNKDYTVFRTLGITKNKMKLIVTAEMMLIALIGIIFAFILLYYLYYTLEYQYLDVVRYNNPIVSTIYFVVMILFSYYISRMFNKRIFKFSVQTTFKGEAVRND